MAFKTLKGLFYKQNNPVRPFVCMCLCVCVNFKITQLTFDLLTYIKVFEYSEYSVFIICPLFFFLWYLVLLLLIYFFHGGWLMFPQQTLTMIFKTLTHDSHVNKICFSHMEFVLRFLTFEHTSHLTSISTEWASKWVWMRLGIISIHNGICGWHSIMKR